jgi:hypothetical protein
MDDYAKELADLQREVDQLVEEEGNPETIAELEMQIQVLGAIYERARELLTRGRQDIELRRRLAMRGYGDWNLDNVYAFVYESVIELPDEGHRKFVAEIVQTDFAGLLAS